MKLSELQKHLANSLRGSGIEPAAQEARLILESRLGLSWADLIAKGDLEIDSAAAESDLQKRIAGMPLGRIYGRKNFYGLEFSLSPETLEPRADTEVLIDIALKRPAPETILDLGTGTGCILLTLLKHFPDSTGLGVDKALGAIATARRNADDLGLAERARFIESDWLESVSGRFDLIVSNPPYIDSAVIPELSAEVKNHDPILALDGGTDGMDAYKIIFAQLRDFLTPGGIALFEIGYDQSRKISRLAEAHGLKLVSIHPDSAGRPRIAEISA